MKRLRTRSSAETAAFGGRLARTVARSGRRRSGATILGLEGDLGAGKTTFVRGFARALGVSPRKISSPTFILMRRIPLGGGPFSNLFHIDAYRIARAGELRHIGFRDLLREPRNIVVVEWADRIARALPKNSVRITFSHGARQRERNITLSF